jgi:hypothetical protein
MNSNVVKVTQTDEETLLDIIKTCVEIYDIGIDDIREARFVYPFDDNKRRGFIAYTWKSIIIIPEIRFQYIEGTSVKMSNSKFLRVIENDIADAKIQAENILESCGMTPIQILKFLK